MKRPTAVAVAAPSTTDAAQTTIDPLSHNPTIPFSHISHHPPSYPLPLPTSLHRLLFHPSSSPTLSLLLLSLELLLGVAIIQRVPYTEIDWVAYMQEVRGFLHGQLDYAHLRGDTGPLVYPAGFVYLYSALYYVTGQGADVRLAQYLFLGLYLVTLYLVHRLYIEATALPPYALLLLSLSKRVHSIFVLRLFNDGLAMALLYAALLALTRRRHLTASLLLSLALSVKMNILLFAPAFLLCLLHALPLPRVLAVLLLMAALQLLLGLPFLLTHPLSYLGRAFEFSRVFFYKWTVNLKMLPEAVFLSPQLALGLLAGHVGCLGWVVDRWSRGGVKGVVQRAVRDASAWMRGGAAAARAGDGGGGVRAESEVWQLLVSNFIGVAFARSLHYQFYVWYWHALPFLLHAAYTPFPTQVGTGWAEWRVVGGKVAVLMAIELCWNVFPATWWSSSLLILCHLYLLIGLLIGNGIDYTARRGAPIHTSAKVK